MMFLRDTVDGSLKNSEDGMLPYALLFAAGLNVAPCDAMKAFTLPQITITVAALVPAGPYMPGRGQPPMAAPAPSLPAHCRIAAVLAPSADSQIEMELWLPIDTWNGKFQAVGNGGWAGNISFDQMAVALQRGYATASNDTGHQGEGTQFLLNHPEKVRDFAERAMHEMTVKSKALIAEFYGRAPQLSYYSGCSTGGRQGLLAAQRYPDDFDGIVAGAPVYNMIHLNAAVLTHQVAVLKDERRRVLPEKLALLANAVLKACDAHDGVSDGLVSDPERCVFDPSSLLCSGADASSCLTQPQVDAVKQVYGGVKTTSGEPVYPGSAPGVEAGMRIQGGAPSDLQTNVFRYLAHQDPKWDVASFELEKDLPLAIRHAGFIEASDPNLSKFKNRGGKLIVYHGWADPGPAPANSINYYTKVADTLGGPQDAWMRLFLMPGVGHCRGGSGPNEADFVAALERWRESGVAPDTIPALHRTDGRVDRTRPLCPYPQLARYKGNGSTDDAANFECRRP
jgi:feruloyl esterase